MNIQLWLQTIAALGYDLGQTNVRQNDASFPEFTLDVGSFILSTPTGIPRNCVHLKEAKLVSTI
jgi:hypothetical protein